MSIELEYESKSIDKDVLDTRRTWNKIESTSRKTGLREGLSDGRKNNFQESFDLGYEEGFKNAFLLAKYKGSFIAQSIQNNCKPHEFPILENTRRGNCEICKNKDLLEEDDVNELIKIQIECYQNSLQYLIHKFNATE